MKIAIIWLKRNAKKEQNISSKRVEKSQKIRMYGRGWTQGTGVGRMMPQPTQPWFSNVKTRPSII